MNAHLTIKLRHDSVGYASHCAKLTGQLSRARSDDLVWMDPPNAFLHFGAEQGKMCGLCKFSVLNELQELSIEIFSNRPRLSVDEDYTTTTKNLDDKRGTSEAIRALGQHQAALVIKGSAKVFKRVRKPPVLLVATPDEAAKPCDSDELLRIHIKRSPQPSKRPCVVDRVLPTEMQGVTRIVAATVEQPNVKVIALGHSAKDSGNTESEVIERHLRLKHGKAHEQSRSIATR